MKKLMIALAAVAMGVAANAATVSWSATAVAKTDHQTDATKYMAYLINANIWADADAAIAGLKSDTPAAGVINSKAGQAQSTNVRFAVSGATAATVAGNSGDVLNSFLLIIDDTSIASAKNYMVAEDTNTTTKFNDSNLATPSFGSQAANTWTAVPEPTSGLLLLLGVAGLALRRRRA